jgi:hypothetical protein
MIHGFVDSPPVIVNMRNSPSFWAFGSCNEVGDLPSLQCSILTFALRDYSGTGFEQQTIFGLGSVDFLTGIYCLGFLDVGMEFCCRHGMQRNLTK